MQTVTHTARGRPRAAVALEQRWSGTRGWDACAERAGSLALCSGLAKKSSFCLQSLFPLTEAP